MTVEINHRPRNIALSDFANYLYPFGYSLLPWPSNLKGTGDAAIIDLIFYKPDLVPSTWPLYDY